MKRLLSLALVIVTLAGCSSSTGPLQIATVGETALVQLAHAAVFSEATAFAGGAFTPAQHQKNVQALLNVNGGEAVLNAALTAWAANSGQPMPVVVKNAIAALTPILADVAPLVGTSGPLATFSADLSAVLAALQAPAASVPAVSQVK